MPIYEYQCLNCNRKFQLLVGVIAAPDQKICPHCQSAQIKRLMSRFARPKSDDDRLEQMANRFEQLDELGDIDDPELFESMTSELSDSMDEEMRTEMEELIESEMSGDSSAEI